MKKKGKSEINDDKSQMPAPWGGYLLIALFGLWVLSHILNRDWNGGLTEPYIIVLLAMGVALLLLPYLKKFSLPGGIEFELRDLPEQVKNIRDIQLIGEVIFNKQDPSQDLFWIDENRLKRRLPDKDTASLFMTPKGAVSVEKNVFDSFAIGPGIPAISRNSFRHVKGHLFVILDNNKISYLSSWSLPVKYGLTTIDEMEEIDPKDFQGFQIFR
jgi:hypothetical protein